LNLRHNNIGPRGIPIRGTGATVTECKDTNDACVTRVKECGDALSTCEVVRSCYPEPKDPDPAPPDTVSATPPSGGGQLFSGYVSPVASIQNLYKFSLGLAGLLAFGMV